MKYPELQNREDEYAKKLAQDRRCSERWPGFILVAIAVVLRMLVKMIEDEEYVRGVQDTLVDEVGTSTSPC